MNFLAALFLLVVGTVSAHAQSMEAAFAKNCPRSVLSDQATIRLHCACVHRQIIETTALPEDREASFALIGPSETLTEALEHGRELAKLPQEMQRAIERRTQPVLQVIVPLCLISAATGKVLPNGTIKK